MASISALGRHPKTVSTLSGVFRRSYCLKRCQSPSLVLPRLCRFDLRRHSSRLFHQVAPFFPACKWLAIELKTQRAAARAKCRFGHEGCVPLFVNDPWI
jgi:hypothetical protein